MSDYSLTLNAMELLAQSGLEKERDKAVNYFIEEINDGYWANTYHTSRIIYTLAMEIGDIGDADNIVSGLSIKSDKGIEKIHEFPYKDNFEPTGSISITKTGGERVFFSYYQEENVRQTVPFTKFFTVDTKFIDKGTGQEISNFKRGERITMVVSFEMKDNEDYVMLEVPIPAGCSYGLKKQGYRDTHREYFKEKIAVFYERAHKGSYTLEFELVPRYSGSYHVNPAKVELMYFPVVYGVNASGKVKIR